MTNGPSVSASIAVVSQIPTEDKNTFNVSACLSKHRGWTPISQPKKNYKSQQAICQSQQALDLDIQIRLSVAASTAFVMTDKTSGGKNNLKINEMLNRMIDILKDKHATWVYLELPQINVEALRKRIIAILKDKHGGANMGLDIPDDEIEALADVLLPGVIKFFSSDEWRAELDAWRKEQELLAQNKIKATENKVS